MLARRFPSLVPRARDITEGGGGRVAPSSGEIHKYKAAADGPWPVDRGHLESRTSMFREPEFSLQCEMSAATRSNYQPRCTAER